MLVPQAYYHILEDFSIHKILGNLIYRWDGKDRYDLWKR